MKVAFRAHIVLHECSNLPQSDARVFCKYKAPGKLEGKSEAVGVQSHRVQWEYAFSLEPVKMTVSKRTRQVEDYNVRLSVRQVENAKFKRLGIVMLNLADFVGKPQATRRYLMQNCQWNATVKVTVHTQQIQGDPFFRARQVPEMPVSNRESAIVTSRVESRRIESRECIFAVVDQVMESSKHDREKLKPSK